MTLRGVPIAIVLMFSLLRPIQLLSQPLNLRGAQFIPFAGLAGFEVAEISTNVSRVFTSPEIQTRIAFNEVIVSWNAEMKLASTLVVEARAIWPERASQWYAMGFWSGETAPQGRHSVRGQKDLYGAVDTDTLVLNRPAERFQLRLTVSGNGSRLPKIKFIGVSAIDSKATFPPLPPNQKAWGKELEVIERSQMWYENGGVLCSPTTVSMLLSYWAKGLNRPGLNVDVPEVVRGVYDPAWGGTGNWVFNTAYAGSFRWMRSYTTRLTDVAELESFITRGIPVGLSVCYNRLRGKGREPSGHLVVCVGFTKTGDVIINDPGTSKNIRKVFPRANLIDAWAYSKNTVYLVYPSNLPLPKDEFGHWESRQAKLLVKVTSP